MDDISSPSHSNCDAGCRLPFISFFQEIVFGSPPPQESEAASLIDSIKFSGFEDVEEYELNVFPKFEELLDRFGLDCVVFYPSPDTAPPTGKKGAIRSKIGEGKAEIRLRTKGEMKKIKFHWPDVSDVNFGRDEQLMSQMSVSDSYEECFLHFTILRRGVINLMFKSKDLRNSCVQAFRILVRHRNNCSSTLS